MIGDAKGDVLVETVVGKESKNPFRIVRGLGTCPIIEYLLRLSNRHDFSHLLSRGQT
jgi:hypothetical protein